MCFIMILLQKMVKGHYNASTCIGLVISSAFSPATYHGCTSHTQENGIASHLPTLLERYPD